MSGQRWETIVFLDHHAMRAHHNVRREMQQPRKHPANPLLVSEHPWEQHSLALYGSVLREPDGGYRMYYMSLGREQKHQSLCLATSDDGVQWRRLMFDQNDYMGQRPTNILLGGAHVNVHGPCVIRNPNPTPDKQFLLLFDSYTGLRPFTDDRPELARWLYACWSRDGISWEPPTGKPVIGGKSDTGQSVVWDEQANVFRAYIRGLGKEGDKPVRIVQISESSDFLTWTPPLPHFQTDERDGAPDTQTYGLSVSRYAGGWLGMLWLLRIHEYRPNPETGGFLHVGNIDVELVFSRDGKKWQRVADRAVFLPTGPAGSWDAGFVTTASQIVFEENEAKIYYSGRDSLHHLPGKRSIGLATVPRDRFCALTPASAEHAWVEVELPNRVTSLHVNADASRGQVRIEWPETSAAMQTITGDSLDHAVRSPAPSASRVRIHLDGTSRLFAIRWPSGETS
jgi:hypothetical protein